MRTHCYIHRSDTPRPGLYPPAFHRLPNTKYSSTTPAPPSPSFTSSPRVPTPVFHSRIACEKDHDNTSAPTQSHTTTYSRGASSATSVSSLRQCSSSNVRMNSSSTPITFGVLPRIVGLCSRLPIPSPCRKLVPHLVDPNARPSHRIQSCRSHQIQAHPQSVPRSCRKHLVQWSTYEPGLVLQAAIFRPCATLLTTGSGAHTLFPSVVALHYRNHATEANSAVRTSLPCT